MTEIYRFEVEWFSFSGAMRVPLRGVEEVLAYDEANAIDILRRMYPSIDRIISIRMVAAFREHADPNAVVTGGKAVQNDNSD